MEKMGSNRELRHLLAIFIMGSEVRQFVHSGLFSLLLEAGWDIRVMSKIVDDDIRRQVPEGIEIDPLLPPVNSFWGEVLSKILDRAFNLRLAREGKTVWKYGKAGSRSAKEKLLDYFILSAGFVFSFFDALQKAGSNLERKCFVNADRKDWREYFEKNRIDAVLVNVPRQPYWNRMLATAQEMGIKTCLIYHTVKDISANGRLNFNFSGIGVWNSSMKADLLHNNPLVDPGSVHVVGCGHFDCVGRQDWLPGEAAFRNLLGVSPDAYLVVYPTAGPGIVPQEERYIHFVVQAIKKVEAVLGKPIQIVFRMNPMDNRAVLFDMLRETYPEHIVTRPDWQDVRKSNWTYARKPDPFFYNALLHYADLCITIPSTVTTDCAFADLPVINLGIEVEGEQPLAGSIQAFWNVDFNRNVRETGAARLAATEEELQEAITSYLKDRSLDREKREGLIMREVDGIRAGQSSERSLTLITSGLEPV